jgi:DNA repair protein RadA/Sms
MQLNLGQPKVNNKTNILDIEVPTQLEENVVSGFAHVDALFAGDGITPSTAALVTGIPGAGKTTLMLQLADAVTGAGHIAIYNTGEESLYQVRKVVRRLGLENGFIPSYESSAQAIVKKARAVQTANPGKQVFLFVDSLQCVEVDREKGQRGRGPSQGSKEVNASAILTAWAKETFGVLMIIGMVTKSGEFAGKQAIRHIVDAHLHLAVDTDRKSDTYGQRVATMEKNRFGQSGLGYVYEINSSGVRFEV